MSEISTKHLNLENTVEALVAQASGGVKVSYVANTTAEMDSIYSSAEIGTYIYCTVTYSGEDPGLWVVTQDNTGTKALLYLGAYPAKGEKGDTGSTGSSPTIIIGGNNHWYINGTDTGVAATGPKGDTGAAGYTYTQMTGLSNSSSNVSRVEGTEYDVMSTTGTVAYTKAGSTATYTMPFSYQVPHVTWPTIAVSGSTGTLSDDDLETLENEWPTVLVKCTISTGVYRYYVPATSNNGYYLQSAYEDDDEYKTSIITVSTSGSWTREDYENPAEIYKVTYGTTTYANITAAITAGQLPVCTYNSISYVYVTTSANTHYFGAISGQTQYTMTVNSSNVYDNGYVYLENLGNKVTSISASSTDTQYPSAKCVYDAIANAKEIYVCEYGTTTFAEVAAALAADKIPMCHYTDSTTHMEAYLPLVHTWYNGSTLTTYDFTGVYKTNSYNATYWKHEAAQQIKCCLNKNQATQNGWEYTEMTVAPYIATYNVTTYTQIKQAADAGETVLLYRDPESASDYGITYVLSNLNASTATFTSVWNGSSLAYTSLRVVTVNTSNTWSNSTVKLQRYNLVTSMSSSSTDTQYPSAKCVYDAIQGAGGGHIYRHAINYTYYYEQEDPEEPQTMQTYEWHCNFTLYSSSATQITASTLAAAMGSSAYGCSGTFAGDSGSSGSTNYHFYDTYYSATGNAIYFEGVDDDAITWASSYILVASAYLSRFTGFTDTVTQV